MKDRLFHSILHEIRRIGLLVCCSSLVLFILSCGEKDDVVEQEEQVIYERLNVNEVLTRDTLRILDIGNSYSQDGTRYLNSIIYNLHQEKDKMCYYILVRGAASFCSWFNCYNGVDDVAYSLTKVAGSITQPVKEGQYAAYDPSGFREALKQKWDVVVLHQVSSYANDATLWDYKCDQGRLTSLIKIVKQQQPDALIVFTLIHSCASDYSANTEHSSWQRWKDIVQATNTIMSKHSEIQLVIPYGTAIETLRRTQLSNESELTRDGVHLGFGLACYSAACCYYETLLAPRTKVSISQLNLRWACSSDEKQQSEYTSSCIDVTDENASIAINAALDACRDYNLLGAVN